MIDHDDEFIDDVADRLRFDDVMAALADTVADTPPASVRSALLAAIRERPRQPAPAQSAPDLYARRVAAMSALLDEFTSSDWAMTAAPYEWTVHGLVAHLTQVEEYTLRQFGLSDVPPLPVGEPNTINHLDLGADAKAAMLVGDPVTTVARWRAAAERVVEHVRGAAYDPSASVPLHAWPFDASTALIARAFEIWTHADDIRRATGRPPEVPSPAELRTMSSASVRALPVLLAITGGPPMQPTRIVLTGPGGGTFDLGTNGHAAFEHLLVADVVDYCRVAARRLDPADLAGHRDGDAELIAALLRAASAVAV